MRSRVPFPVNQQVLPQFDLNISAGFTDVYVVQVFHMSLNLKSFYLYMNSFFLKTKQKSLTTSPLLVDIFNYYVC